jgi:hypothetical protein
MKYAIKELDARHIYHRRSLSTVNMKLQEAIAPDSDAYLDEARSPCWLIVPYRPLDRSSTGRNPFSDLITMN